MTLCHRENLHLKRFTFNRLKIVSWNISWTVKIFSTLKFRFQASAYLLMRILDIANILVSSYRKKKWLWLSSRQLVEFKTFSSNHIIATAVSQKLKVCYCSFAVQTAFYKLKHFFESALDNVAAAEPCRKKLITFIILRLRGTWMILQNRLCKKKFWKQWV